MNAHDQHTSAPAQPIDDTTLAEMEAWLESDVDAVGKGFGSDSHFDPDQPRDDHGRWGSSGHADYKPMPSYKRERVEKQARKEAMAAIAEHVGVTVEEAENGMAGIHANITSEQELALRRISDAIISYTGSGYRDLNRKLREGKALNKEQQAMVEALNLTKVDLPKGTIVFRGLSADKANLNIDRFKVDKTFRLKGFNSSSLDPFEASSFGHSRQILLAIKAKRGSYPPDNSEQEIVLPRNTLFKVKGFTKIDDMRVVQVEQLLYGQKEVDFDIIEVH